MKTLVMTLALLVGTVATITSAQAMCHKRCKTNDKGDTTCVTVCN